jgi:hypothetical protein
MEEYIKAEIAKPNPKSTINSYRSVGYNLATAISDIIDNSISAIAIEIRLEYKWNGQDSFFSICDNSTGMNRDELVLAMTPESKEPEAWINYQNCNTRGHVNGFCSIIEINEQHASEGSQVLISPNRNRQFNPVELETKLVESFCNLYHLSDVILIAGRTADVWFGFYRQLSIPFHEKSEIEFLSKVKNLASETLKQPKYFSRLFGRLNRGQFNYGVNTSNYSGQKECEMCVADYLVFQSSVIDRVNNQMDLVLAKNIWIKEDLSEVIIKDLNYD